MGRTIIILGAYALVSFLILSWILGEEREEKK